ncbi:EF_hand domain-containing protein [Hexamita inflata]|uniref:EF hand domain-containing protein n=1 Tax=Hexamita inflata TaxID=28002 RepID=A0AA86R5W1_9EUKA|nr:EF hand domain-containing protein [Hexamita inflata]
MGCSVDEIQEPVLLIDEHGVKHCSLEFVREFFTKADKDKSGEVDIDELVSLLMTLGMEINHNTGRDIAATIQIADDNENQTLEFEEFKQFLYSFLNAPANDLPSILFYVGDRDESNTIDEAELFKILKKVGAKASEEQVRELMKVLKGDKEGIDFPIFRNLLEKLGVI